jgi:Na+/H+ antiporter NhaD/arsenite permease-like protein
MEQPGGSLLYGTPIPLWAALPFFLLLLAIAVIPLLNKHWWDRYYPVVSIGLGAVTAAYYILVRGAPLPILHSEIEFISFIALIGSLFVIAGGIHIRLWGRSRPLTNVAFLAFGALIANLIGTTGASMILIRPFIRVNRYRVKAYHVVFFIFVVSNMGGALTPIGDPPLFLGYLKGVPFFWILQSTWHIWLCAMAIVLAVFYVIDRRVYGKLTPEQRHRTEDLGEKGEVAGLHNLCFLGIVLSAVFVNDPPFVREVLMVSAALGSHLTTKKEIHKKNDFDFVPIKEVAILFLGIFTTMVPALEWIAQNSGGLGFRVAGQFYWATGALSSVLDNAPTYLNFLSAAVGVFVDPDVVRDVTRFVHLQAPGLATLAGGVSSQARMTLETLLRYHGDSVRSGAVTIDQITTSFLMTFDATVVQAISLGAVFFGAMTYIGNGPNLMVKSIAEQSGVRCPSFGSYIGLYSIPVLLPTFVIIWGIFFRN